MTQKICIIGDSHIAAFKSIWNTGSERWPSLDVDVFGAHSDNLASFYVRDGQYVTDDIGKRQHLRDLTGKECLDLDQYDALVVTGMKLSITTVIRLLRTTSHLNQPSRAKAMNSGEMQLEAMLPRQLLSNRLVDICLRERLQRKLLYTVAHNLAKHTRSQHTKTKMFIASQPRPSVHALKLGKAYNGFRVLKRDGDHAYAEQLFEKHAEELSKSLEAHYLPQPDITRENHLFTSKEFSMGSVRLHAGKEKRHKSNDVLHANPRYAGRVLDQLVTALGNAS